MATTAIVITTTTAIIIATYSSTSRIIDVATTVIVLYNRFINFSFIHWIKVFVFYNFSVDIDNLCWMNVLHNTFSSPSVYNGFRRTYFYIVILRTSVSITTTSS